MNVKKFLSLFCPNVSDIRHVYYRCSISDPWCLIPKELVSDPNADTWKKGALAALQVNSFFVKSGCLYVDAR